MTAFEKIAVSLPVRAVQGARRAVLRGRAKSVSAYIASAVEEKEKLHDLAALLDEMLAASGGPLTSAERHSADRTLGIEASKSPRRATRATRATRVK